ncbi:MAG: hypothetical protein HS115_19350 [Spirochaetales bacterium]|nr:hypothetical protein [Spirochaetales bacterium]
MWLRLGDSEIVNMEHVELVRKVDPCSIEIMLRTRSRELPFEHAEDRDRAFEKLVSNLVKLRSAME